MVGSVHAGRGRGKICSRARFAFRRPPDTTKPDTAIRTLYPREAYFPSNVVRAACGVAACLLVVPPLHTSKGKISLF